MPLHRMIEAHVLAADRLHGDDTTVPLLARGGTKTARLWTYVRDDLPFAGTTPPAVIFKFSRDRGGEHPTGHLKGWTAILQADAYAGYNQLYDPNDNRRPSPQRSAGATPDAGSSNWQMSRAIFERAKQTRKSPPSPPRSDAI